MAEDKPQGEGLPDGSLDELLDLVWDLNEGAVDGAGGERLNELLLADAASRAAYLQFMQVIAALEWEGVGTVASRGGAKTWAGDALATASEIISPASAGHSLTLEEADSRATSAIETIMRRWRNISRPLMAAICASLATVATILAIQQRGSPSPGSNNQQHQMKPSDPGAAPIAYLASAIGYSWGEDSPRLQAVGSPISLGEEVTLQEGIAEFRLSSGVYLSIEGPAGLVLNSPNSVVLQYGKLTSHVPESAGSFKVLAGASRLTARGGEFGVYLAGGDVDLHVFSGQVLAVNASYMERRGGFEEVYGGDQYESGAEPANVTGVLTNVVVRKGRALALTGDGDAVKIVSWGSADDTKFATRLPMAEPLPITNAYVDAVLASKPVNYWRFKSIVGQLVKNEVPDGDELRVIGNVRLAGENGNRVVELGKPESNGFLVGSERSDAVSRSDYSVEVWLRPSHFHAAAIVMLAGLSPETQDERPSFYLGLHGAANAPSARAFSGLHPWSVRFLNRDPPSGDQRTGVSIYSRPGYQPRRWQHVVAVKEGPDMRLYINGKLVATGLDESSLAPGLRLIVGEGSTTQRTYPFRGQLDELAIYKRALTEQEVRRHFRAVRWTPERQETIRHPASNSIL